MIRLFLVLQVMDLATTLICFQLGLVEGNPAIRWMMRIGPAAGVLLAKIVAVAILGLCLWLRRPRTIRKANYFFLALVIWNSLLVSIKMAEMI